MAESKFTAKNKESVIALVGEGLSLADAARETGLSPETVDGWLKKSRRDDPGDYAGFAAEVDAARLECQQREEPGTEEELKRITWIAAKKGSVQAMKLYWEMVRKSSDPDEVPEDPFAALDGPVDLAVVRERKSA